MIKGRACRQGPCARLPLGPQGSRRQPLDSPPGGSVSPLSREIPSRGHRSLTPSEGLNRIDLVSYGEVPGAARGVNSSHGRFLLLWDPRVPQSVTAPCALFARLIF